MEISVFVNFMRMRIVNKSAKHSLSLTMDLTQYQELKFKDAQSMLWKGSAANVFVECWMGNAGDRRPLAVVCSPGPTTRKLRPQGQAAHLRSLSWLAHRGDKNSRLQTEL